MIGWSLDSALAAYLELLAAAAQPGFDWGLAELRAAFQWADTLQQLVDSAEGSAAVQARLQVLRPRLPAGLQAALPAAAHRPLQLMVERLLAWPAAASFSTAPECRAAAKPTVTPDSCWLGAVVGAYVTAVVLRRPPGPEQAAAERHLIDTLADLQQAAAAHSLLQAEAQAAAAAAACELRCRSSKCSAGQAPGLPAAERQELLGEALRCLTCSEGLELAAAAQLLTHQAEEHANQQGERQAGAAAAAEPGSVASLREQPEATDLASVLHSPPTALELELLCLVALLPCWEAVLQRLTRSEGPCKTAGGMSHVSGGNGAAAQAVQLLCSACSKQPDDVLALHPALLAEVCRCSFRLTCAYAALLVRHQRAAGEGTRASAEAARWRVAHAAKHPDHVSSYLLAKGCTL